MTKKILFLCTHNSSRSQIAEGIVNHLSRSSARKYIAKSAGTEKTSVNSYAIQVMKEIGIDISDHYSKHVDQFIDEFFDYVVTVCDGAKESCPYFPNTNNFIHQSFADPTEFIGSESERIKYFAKIRDEIYEWIYDYFYK